MEEQSFAFIDAVIFLITLLLLVSFVIFLSMIMTYFKTVAMTIKTILKAAFEAKSPFLAFKDDIKQIRHTKLREEAEANMRDVDLQDKYFTKWTIILHECGSRKRQDHEEEGQLHKLKQNKYNLLNPPLTFYIFIYLCGIIIVWICSGFFTGIFNSSLRESLMPGIFWIPLLVALISTSIIIIYVYVIHYIYLENIRMAFKNAFLSKVNCPKDFKQVRYPEGYDSKNFQVAFDEILKDYAEQSMRNTAKESEFGKHESKSLAQILGYETTEGSGATESKINDDSSASNISTMKFNKFSILNTTKLSVKEVKEKVKPLKDNLYLFGNDTARPIISEDILEKIGEEEDSNEEPENILDGSNPNIDRQVEKIEENKETEYLDTEQNIASTGDKLLRRKIKTAVKKHLIKPYHLGDTGLLQHECKKKENLLNVIFFGGIVCFVAVCLAILCYKMYYYATQVTWALILIAIFSMILEIFVYRIVSWWAYVIIHKCYKSIKQRRRRAQYQMNNKNIVNLSEDPNKFKELFKKYPGNFISADVDYKPPKKIINMNDILDNQGEGEGDNFGRGGPFDPANEDDLRLAHLRNSNKSDMDMENDDHPQFNSELPYFNESDKSSMAELRDFNKLLIDKMYTAYNEKADELLRRGNLKDITKEGEGINQLEKEREEDINRGRKNYNIAAEVFGIAEESDEDEYPERKKLIKKKKAHKTQIPDTYYRDIAMVKARMDLARKKKNKGEAKSEMNQSTGFKDKYKGKGVYALNQLKPLAKQEIYKQEEPKPKMKPKTRQIPRTQMAIVPGSPRKAPQKDYTEYPSTEPIDEGHVKFQSAEKSAGVSTKRLLQLGLTSIQEQPHKFARPTRKHSEEVKSPNRHITHSHLAAVRGNFVEEVKDGESTESVPLSKSFGAEKERNRNPGIYVGLIESFEGQRRRDKEASVNIPQSANSFKDFSDDFAISFHHEETKKSPKKRRQLSGEKKLDYKLSKKRKIPVDPELKFHPATNQDLDHIYGKVYDPFVKHNVGAVCQIDKEVKERKLNNYLRNIDEDKNGIFLFGNDVNSKFDFNPKKEKAIAPASHLDMSYSVAPPSYIKIVGKKKKKKTKKKKQKVKRQHLAVDDFVII
ncbi:unnamed protein product [Moneuplotes crassus]|uniref:Uncharacterized protein n=1 Tax=Euplotes crassus TaxID=5936 RepID=A0AAD1XGJ4_EUPCR|nr:unnamed protein product [Moneuplotes crassus]